jgi:hypothetical protein
MNLLVVLIPMLLMCAEFARISIIDLSIAARGANPDSTQTEPPAAARKDSLLLTLLITDSTVTVVGRSGILPTIRYAERGVDGYGDVELLVVDSALNVVYRADSTRSSEQPLSAYTEIRNVLNQIRERHNEAVDGDALTIASQSTVVYDKIVKIMDIARHAGFLDISISRLREDA